MRLGREGLGMTEAAAAVLSCAGPCGCGRRGGRREEEEGGGGGRRGSVLGVREGELDGTPIGGQSIGEEEEEEEGDPMRLGEVRRWVIEGVIQKFQSRNYIHDADR